MIEKILKNIAYTYYPKGLSIIDNKNLYLNSVEYNRMKFVLEDVILYFNNIVREQLINEFKKHDLLHTINDVSVLEWQDRALSFEIEIIEDDRLVKICLNISLIIPYYIIYVLENEIQLDPYKWITLPKRNEKLELSKYDGYLKLISKIVEEITRFSSFPKNIANVVLPDLSFNDIRIGKFTFFNAFFLDNNYI